MYITGRGVTEDYAEAVKWYRNAAEQGYPVAQKQLGLHYYFGYGVTQDYVKAHALANIAAARGISTGVELRDLLASEMTAADISKAQQLAGE